MTQTRNVGWLATVGNVATVLIVLYALFRAEGPVGSKIVAWNQVRHTKRAISRDWDAIARGSRLDSSAAGVKVVEFSDYECPFCRKQHLPLTRAINDYKLGGVVFRHLPLVIHEKARGAAIAAICAESQGSFLKMHEYLMTTDAWMRDTNWVQIAHTVGVRDTTVFRTCLSLPATSVRLETDKAAAASLGVVGTPSFVTRAGVVNGVLSDSVMQEMAARLHAAR